MTATKNFTDFDAWKKAMDLAVRVHHMTKAYPGDERYGLVQQLRRASVSIAANIAEGFGRYTYADKMHKYVQARGELVEVITELHYSHRVRYLTDLQNESLQCETEDVYKLLNALITKMHVLSLRSRGPQSEVLSPKSESRIPTLRP